MSNALIINEIYYGKYYFKRFYPYPFKRFYVNQRITYTNYKFYLWSWYICNIYVSIPLFAREVLYLAIRAWSLVANILEKLKII